VELTDIFESADYTLLRAALMLNLTDWMVLTSDITPVVTDSRGPPKYAIRVCLAATARRERGA